MNDDDQERIRDGWRRNTMHGWDGTRSDKPMFAAFMRRFGWWIVALLLLTLVPRCWRRAHEIRTRDSGAARQTTNKNSLTDHPVDRPG